MTKRGEAEGARLSPGVLRGEGGRKKVHSHRDPSFHSVSGGPFRCTPHSQERPLEELEGRGDAETGPGPEQTKRHAGHPWGLGWTHLPRAHEEVLAPTVLCPFRASPQRSGDSYSPGDEAVSAVPSSRGVSEPSSEHGPGWWLSLESEARVSPAGGDRELSVHLAVSVWKLPTGVVPPDSPARDLSSSRWASSTSLSLVSLTVSCSMVWKMLPTSLRARLGAEWLGRPRPPLLPQGCQAGRLSGCEGSVLESGGPAGMLT